MIRRERGITPTRAHICTLRFHYRGRRLAVPRPPAKEECQGGADNEEDEATHCASDCSRNDGGIIRRMGRGSQSQRGGRRRGRRQGRRRRGGRGGTDVVGVYDLVEKEHAIHEDARDIVGLVGIEALIGPDDLEVVRVRSIP